MKGLLRLNFMLAGILLLSYGIFATDSIMLKQKWFSKLENAGLIKIKNTVIPENRITNSQLTYYKELENGKVLQKKVKGRSLKTSMPIDGSQCMILIDAPTDKVWQVINDKENLPKIVHQIQDVEVVQSDGQQEVVRTSVKICRLLPKFNYVLCFDNTEKHRRMRFEKTDGCFKELFGSFEFIPYGKSTILGYRIYSDPGFPIPKIAKKGLRSNAEEIMRAIKEEAENLQ